VKQARSARRRVRNDVGSAHFPDPGDLESLTVRNSPVFQALIAESRRVNPPGTGLSTEEVRRVLAPRRARRARK
jgi:hypothetical protein